MCTLQAMVKIDSPLLRMHGPYSTATHHEVRAQGSEWFQGVDKPSKAPADAEIPPLGLKMTSPPYPCHIHGRTCTYIYIYMCTTRFLLKLAVRYHCS